MRRYRLLIIVVLLVAVAAGAWVFRSPGPPDVILISLDTCRADHLGCYDASHPLTPNIDAFARQASRFTEVTSPVPQTLPAHASIMTGKIPPCHGVHDNINYKVPDDNDTLAEVLKRHGYKTAAMIAAFVLDKQFGLDQGFDTYDDQLDESLTFMAGYPERRAADVNRSVFSWLDGQAAEPFFLFVHYYDPHHPYRPPDPYDLIYADAPYEGEVAYTDHQLGLLFDKLKSLKRYDASLIVITADHGEGLGEHGEEFHGFFVYRSTTHVPLLIKLPHQKSGRVVGAKTSLVDLFPTLLSQLGLDIPSDLSGRDLSPLMTGEPAPAKDRFVYTESMLGTKYGIHPLIALESRRWKFIQTTRPELYDLRQDPNETINLAPDSPDHVRGFRQDLAAMLESDRCARVSQGRETFDAETLNKLRSLGYTGGEVRADFDLDANLPDPKDYIRVLSRIESIDFHINRGELDKSRDICESVLADGAELAFVHAKLGQIAVLQGRDGDALRQYQKAVELDDRVADWHHNIGVLLVRLKRPSEAIQAFQKTLALDPNHAKTREMLNAIQR